MAGVWPKEFVCGTAVSADQIEGAVERDGRTDRVWDRFSRTPTRLGDGSTGAIDCGHRLRYPEDIAPMPRLSVGADRFRTARPHILPDGRGPTRIRGGACCDPLIDGLLTAGIMPWRCPQHWDMPRALAESGGDTAQHGADDADGVVRRLGDRGRLIAPPNGVPWVAYDARRDGPDARSRSESLAALNLAHGLAVPAIRAQAAAIELILLAPVQPAVDDAAHRRPAAEPTGMAAS